MKNVINDMKNVINDIKKTSRWDLITMTLILKVIVFVTQ